MNKFGIYFHWPYCRSKCPYCDFVSLASKAFDFDLWEKRYAEELAFFAKRFPNKQVSSIFFGGGTPSLIRAETIHFIIETIRSYYDVAENVEISLEANPCSLDAEKIYALRKSGVNRLSVGVQSLNENDLKFLGRLHSKEQALNILKIAKDTFDSLSADFIYALPHRTLKEWEQELEQILCLNLKHLSLYQLTIEEGTFFYKKGIRPPEDELSADLFELTDRMTYQAGLERYEVSNHSLKGFECRHNLLYWQGGEWLGIGPSAHGRMTQGNRFIALKQTNSVPEWLNGTPCEEIELLEQEKAEELILMALRTKEGLQKQTFQTLLKKPVEDFLNQETLQDYQTDGLMINNEKSIKVTRNGLLLLDALCRNLI